MSTDRNEIGTAKASPTKQFFVNMLTRDIELQDSLLDLLDNCVDGILRSRKVDPSDPKPYAGFKASMTLSDKFFMIEDNCGGIPYETAVKYAFAMGRPPNADAGGNIGTVGMYGIGMKRAIFKLGSQAKVESRNDRGFVVEISPTWMTDDTWNDLPMYQLAADRLPAGGTIVHVTKLHPDISKAFSDQDWIDEFRKQIARHYALIIEKGFEVLVGSAREPVDTLKPIKGDRFALLMAADGKDGEQLSPYIYTGELEGVSVEIYAGLYRKLLDEDELEQEDETRASKDDAGWTVACNDRVVIWRDKTKLTGWGEATVPNYHGQFIAITGLVLLRSDDPKKLPLTTTKRGIDGASLVYLDTKDLMREATKAFTNFTNKWKKFPDKLEDLYQASEYADLPTLRTLAAEVTSDSIRKYPTMKRHSPKLPVPKQEKTSSRISFVALNKDIEHLALHFFEDAKVKPNVVGEAAFNFAVEETKK